MKNILALVCVVAFLALWLIGVHHDDVRNQRYWDDQVGMAKNLPACQDGTLKFVKILPPPELRNQAPRFVLFQEEIEKIDFLDMKAEKGGFEVFYKGKSIGFCSISK